MGQQFLHSELRDAILTCDVCLMCSRLSKWGGTSSYRLVMHQYLISDTVESGEFSQGGGYDLGPLALAQTRFSRASDARVMTSHSS
jgi:hypothetical protein